MVRLWDRVRSADGRRSTATIRHSWRCPLPIRHRILTSALIDAAEGREPAWVTTPDGIRLGAGRPHAARPRARRYSRHRPAFPPSHPTRAVVAALPLPSSRPLPGRRASVGMRPTSTGTGAAAATAGSAVSAPARRTARVAAPFVAFCGVRDSRADHLLLGARPFVLTV